MAYPELSTVNMSEGLYKLPIYISEIEPYFFPYFLFAIFIMLAFGSYLIDKSFSNKGHIRASFAVAGLITTILAYFMSLIPMVNGQTVIICLVLEIVFVLLLFIPQNR